MDTAALTSPSMRSLRAELERAENWAIHLESQRDRWVDGTLDAGDPKATAHETERAHERVKEQGRRIEALKERIAHLEATRVFWTRPDIAALGSKPPVEISYESLEEILAGEITELHNLQRKHLGNIEVITFDTWRGVGGGQNILTIVHPVAAA